MAKEALARKISEAVQKKYPKATNIETTVTEKTTTDRRQLRDRRALEETTVETESTWDSEDLADSSDTVDVDLGSDLNVVSSTSSVVPTEGTIEGGEAVPSIDAELPTGEEEDGEAPTGGDGEKTKAPTGGDGEKTKEPTKAPTDDKTTKAPIDISIGAKNVVFGTAAAICAALWFL